MKPCRKSFGIWVPDKSLSDNRGFISPGVVGAVAGSRRRTSGATYLIREQFEGPGKQYTWSENLDGGFLTYNYTTSPAPLQGSYSLYFNASGDATRMVHTLAADADFLSTSFLVRFRTGDAATSLPGDGVQFFQILDNSNAVCAGIEIKAGSAIRARHGTGDADTVATVATDTLYRFWLDYTKATSGSNGQLVIAFATDGSTRPTSGNYRGTTSVGSISTAARKICIGRISGNNSWAGIWDDVIGSTTSIGDIT